MALDFNGMKEAAKGAGEKIAGFAKNAAETTTVLAKSAAEKTGDAVETGKLNIKIKTEESKIADAMEELGKYFYRKYKEDVIVEEAVRGTYTEIDEHYRIIAETKEQIEKIKEEKRFAE